MDRERTAVMVARLKELAHATAEQRWREFSMRVPADTERDADLVLMRAAMHIEQQQATIDDLCETIELNLICDLGPTRLADILAALDRAKAKTPNVQIEAPDAALSRQVACTDGLGLVPGKEEK
jgi:hypothetical protein